MIEKKRNMSIKSYSENQDDILKGIIDLHIPQGIEVDLTFGKGVFYKNIPKPILAFDVDPQFDFVVKSNSIKIPLKDQSVTSIMFDPPFLTYVKNGRDHHDNFVMSKRFGGYYTYGDLENHYKKTLSESYRVLKKKGFLVFKCQDIVHNHKLHCTHHNVIKWSEESGFRLKDLFLLVANHRMPRANKGPQQHARIHHCFFLVLFKP